MPSIKHSICQTRMSAIPLSTKCWLSALCLVFSLQHAAAQTAGALSITGNSSYTINFTNGTVALNVDRVENTFANYISGTLQLELWATSIPYSGGGISGYQVTTYRLGQLAPQSYYYDISASNLLIESRPAQGAYYAALLLTEYSDTCTSSDKFCIVDYVNFSSPLNVPAQTTSVIPVDNSSGGGGSMNWLLLSALGLACVLTGNRVDRLRV